MKGILARAFVFVGIVPIAVHSKVLQNVHTKNIDETIQPRSMQHVSMSTINKNFESYQDSHNAFLSATVDSTLYPVKGKMTEQQKVVFEQGMLSVLSDKLTAEASEDGLIIISVTTTKNALPIIVGEALTGPKTLTVQMVVSAQQILPTEDTSKMITKAEFGQMVVNLISIYDDTLKNRWNTIEIDSNVETEGVKFSMLEDLRFTLFAPEELYAPEGKSFGLTSIILVSIVGSMTLVAILFIIYQKGVQRGFFTESMSLMGYPVKSSSKFKTNQNIQDLLKKGVQDEDVTFAPYTDVQLNPPRLKHRNRYSKLTVTSGNTDDDEFDLSSSKSEEDDFTDIGQEGSDGLQLSLNGTAMKGVCFAPPGKLGVAIDTVNGKPVVHRVRDDSPVSGVLRKYDLIIAIDDVNTSSMTAADVTSLMAKRMGANRKITYMRGSAPKDSLRKKSAL